MAELERERERDQHMKQLARSEAATNEMAQTVASIKAELEDEKRARQTAEFERDEHRKQLAIFEAATSDIMAKTATTIEVERAAMRNALTNMMYEQKRQTETISRKQEEEREKMVTEVKLDGERRINAVFQEIAEEREKMSAIRKREDWVLSSAAQADREEKMSLLVTQRIVEATQTAKRLRMEAREKAEQEVKDYAARQELQSRLVSSSSLDYSVPFAD